jgi:hypothetical protein
MLDILHRQHPAICDKYNVILDYACIFMKVLHRAPRELCTLDRIERLSEHVIKELEKVGK